MGLHILNSPIDKTNLLGSGLSTALFLLFSSNIIVAELFNVISNLSLLSSRLKVPLCINFSTLLAIVLLFILLSVAFSHSDYKTEEEKFNNSTLQASNDVLHVYSGQNFDILSRQTITEVCFCLYI